MSVENKGLKKHKVLAVVVLCLFFFEMMGAAVLMIPSAGASEVTKGKKTFKVSAYYSPLPGQERYLRGTYEAEVKLNGEGVHGASGVSVHPGMIAAPKTYAFGTRIKLEGLGMGTVEDRGGAIVLAGADGQSYDRLDVWMGYGDEGLKRALNWGMRVVDGEILSSSEADSINFQGLVNGAVSEIKIPEKSIQKDEALKLQEQVKELTARDDLLNSFPVNVGLGSNGDHVKLLQVTFKKLGYFKGTISGMYDQDLVNAVLTFQVAKKIITSEEETSAGYFGLKTRMTLIDILMNKKITIEDLEHLVLTAKDVPEVKVIASTIEKQVPLLVTFAPVSQMEIPVKEKKEKMLVELTSSSSVPFIAVEKTETAVLSNTVDFKIPAPSTSLVEDVQAKLLLMGYNPGPVTGKFTAKTSIALREFQRNNSLPVTGKLNPAVANTVHTIFLTSSATMSTNSNFNVALKGSKLVGSLQAYLKRKGMYQGEMDGTFARTFLDTAKKMMQ